MNRIRTVLLLVCLLPALVWAGAPSAQHSDLSLPDLQGQQHSLGEYHGKILVVNFWATWCGPCKHEMPLFADALKHFGADRVQILAVSLDDASTRSKIPGFAQKEKMSFPILLGSTSDMQKLGLGEALPATMFVDGNGQIVAKVLGEISKAELRDRLDYMLGESHKEPPAFVNNLNKKSTDTVAVPMMH